MGDVRSCWIDFGADYSATALGLDEDNGLETAIVISLFSDRRARPDDVLPDGSDDRRGWWGDSVAAQDGDRIGSRLWLLAREKQLVSVLARSRDYAREALQWLVDDGVARDVQITAEIIRQGVLGLDVTVLRATGGPVRFRFETFWKGSSNAV